MLMSHRPTFLIWSLLSLVSAGSTGAELPFPVAEAKMQTLPDEQILDGVIEAVNQSTVSAQTAGRVEEIMVDVNDFVPQGAPIIRIRNIEQRAGLEQAQANCAKLRPASWKPRPSTTAFAAFTNGNWFPKRRWIQPPPL
jgi:multidrug efflux pump subunit AcrA (membrane-fusion protein)